MQQQILDAARQAFVIHGYEGASMRSIAKNANTSIGNIYHYYANNEALLDALLESTIVALNQLVEEHLKLSVQVGSVEEINHLLKLSLKVQR